MLMFIIFVELKKKLISTNYKSINVNWARLNKANNNNKSTTTENSNHA